jgi:endonuclease/exonuclease/phosphatase family metal-dependent hydrolase
MASATAILESRSSSLPTTLRNRKRVEQEKRLTIPLNIVTYNVHLLPEIAARVAGERSQSGYRAAAIAERLVHFDLVGLAEVFDRKCSARLVDGLQARSGHAFHVAHGPRRSGRALIHSGLVLLSRHEIEATHTITYRNASRLVTHGIRADGFAAKGVLHARLRMDQKRGRESFSGGLEVGALADKRLPTPFVDCFLTHLESRSARARQLQIEQLSAFVEEHSCEENPVVLMGDFNVAADTESYAARRDGRSPYRRLRRKLTHNGRRLVDVWDTLSACHGGTSDALAPDGGRRLDYIFVSDPVVREPDTSDSSRLTPRDIVSLPFTDRTVAEGSLSDHLAVACRAEFQAALAPAWR